jgi:hypothetical protein
VSPLQRLAGSVLPIASLATAAALLGCTGYSSEYVPLADGRARPVYRDDTLVMEVGGRVTAACADAIADPRLPGAGSGVSVRSGSSVWIPVYYGPRIVVVGGVAPSPRRAVYTGASPNLTGVSGRPGGGSGSSGGGGLGKLDKEAIVIVAVIALVALPAITFGLALGRPEPEDQVANVIDRVNLYNDLARSPGTPCSIYGAPMPGDSAQ